MAKFILSLVILVYSADAYSQRERVHLDLDKYSCKAGDTIWFKGYIFQGPYPSPVSTNLYVEVFSAQGILVQRTLWPVVRGQSPGQLILPDSLPTDNYYIVALTKQQLNYDTLHFFSVPVVVYNKEKPSPIHHKKQFSNPGTVTAGLIKGIYWVTTISQGHLSSMLELDSGRSSRRLRLMKWINSDSVLAADITFDSAHLWKYADFPVDSIQSTETLFLYEDSALIGRQVLTVSDRQQDIKIIPDTLDTSTNGYNSWALKLPDSTLYWMSITVTDADRSLASPVTIQKLAEAYTDDLTVLNHLVDSSYITFTGNATKENYLFGGKKIKDPFSREIVMTGVRDSNFVFIKTVRMDDGGNFKLDSLFFFDSISLQFQINKEEDGSTKNIRLTLAKFLPPPIDSSTFSDWVDEGGSIGKEDTTFTAPQLSRYKLAKMKTLKAAIVKHWESPRKELDHLYASGAFSEPSVYSFDVRTERRFHDIGSYLRMQMGMQGGFGETDTPSLDGHPIVWFVDQQVYLWPELGMFDWDRIAYIKVLRSDFLIDDPFIKWKTGLGGFELKETGVSKLPANQQLKVPVSGTPYEVCIYLRKGKDFRTMPGGLNKISVRGYDRILPFKTNNVTLLWDPWAAGNEYRIRFTNNETTRRFRVKVEGVSHTGKIIHYETILQ